MKRNLILILLVLTFFLSGCAGKPAEAPNGEYFIRLEHDAVDLVVGQEVSVAIAAFTKDGAAADPAYLRYASADTNIVSVEGGKLKGVGVGETSVTVSCKNASVTLSVRVWEYASSDDMTSNSVQTYGRTYTQDGGIVVDNVNSGIGFAFYGTQCKISIMNIYGASYVRYYVDEDTEGARVLLSGVGQRTYTFAKELEKGVHRIRIMKATEQNFYAKYSFRFDEIETGEDCVLLNRFREDPKKEKLKIDFYGDSITAGEGNLIESPSAEITVANSDGTQTYAAFTAAALGSESSFVGYGGITVKARKWNGQEYTMFEIWNWYSTFNQTKYPIDPDTDFVVINLGTNDAAAYGSGTNADKSKKFAEDYRAMLDAMTAVYTKAKFVLCYGMMGTEPFIDLGIQRVIKDLPGKAYYCSLPSNTDGAGRHPSVAGHRAAAETLTAFIQELLGN